MNKCTQFEGFNKPVADKSISEVIDEIRKGHHKEPIEKLRLLIAQGETDKADRLKKKLLGFTPSGCFSTGRRSEFLNSHSGLIHLDFDKISPSELDRIKPLLTQIEFTRAFFVSPSGNGIKVFVEADVSIATHSLLYIQIQKYYEEKLGILADPACKDVTRLCFVSYDEEAYLNINSKFYIAKSSNDRREADSNCDFVECVNLTKKQSTYQLGNRNNFIFKLGKNCQRKGITQDEAYKNILSLYDLPTSEIQSTIRSAYSTVSSISAENKDKSIEDTELDDKIIAKQSPTIPLRVYENLPDLLHKSVTVFSDPREKDVLLTSVLSVTSGCLFNVMGIYDKDPVYPNLYSFVVAPAASGKGVMKYARKLGSKYHNLLLEKYKNDLRLFNAELAAYKMALRSAKKGDKLEEPIPPKFIVFYIPANVSQAMILSHLQDNDGKGVIFETEADSMGNALKQDWGSYSDLMRKAFHHEPISSSRKTNSEFISIEKPRLSIAISGTQGQVSNLIHSAEDGLFSRFIYYTFNAQPKWRDVSPKANIGNLDTYFENLSQTIVDLIEHTETYPLEVALSEKQWVLLNDFGAKCLNNITCFNSEEAASIPKRMLLIGFKIMLILTSLRRFEDGDTIKSLPCSQEDFEVSLILVETYLEHSVIMYNKLPKTHAKVQPRSSDKQALFAKLPQKFSRKDAITLATQLKIGERTTDSFLKKLVEIGELTQPSFGNYEKHQKT
jgi:hypothetical protein